MKTCQLLFLVLLGCVQVANAQAPANRFTAALANKENRVNIHVKEDQQKIEVEIDGRPFTTYSWASNLERPALFPILSAKGTPITRGYPVAPRPNERVDHPNQVGMFLGYANVNGIDFWNSPQSPSEKPGAKYGKIVHKAVKAHISGKLVGRFEVESEWQGPDKKPILQEISQFAFEGSGNDRTITRTIFIKALTETVFTDDAQGFLGIRLARDLEHKYKTPIILTGPDGKPMATPTLNGATTGQFTNSESIKLDSVYGKRAEWIMLTGQIASEPITLALFDYPKNVGFPSYGTSSGEGLLALNPFGHFVFSKGIEVLDLKLAKGESIVLQYMLRIQSGRQLQESDCERIYTQFSTETGE